MKTFEEYHNSVNPLAQYPGRGSNLIYPALGLAGEAGETVDKIKKLWRNKNISAGTQLSPEDKKALLHELGDVLWYVDALAEEAGSSLGEVAFMNAEKLHDRRARGVIKSEGDNR